MRRFLFIPVSLLLSGCGPLLPESWVPDLSALWEPTPPEAEPDPPGSLAARAPADGTPALRLTWAQGSATALLVSQNGERRLWRSGGGVVVATDGARVTATAGLREWIAGTRLDGSDPLDEPLALLVQSASLRRQVDFMRNDRSPDRMRFGVALSCRLGATQQGPVVLVRETCRGGGNSFTNRYWADPATGGIFRSEQWVGEIGAMRLDVITPPS
ncbi:YjbF family lipoprotein [Teichococcus vastitatis]|uniref:YjbF family lipoprotein n=1 Tax=Teichococcus vastitatis TaxID=2307076 RepID=A0ABS9W5S1_9PROT|nr:YjbF family lipoprotein [Pseudoroseomonas vastitatis]MCI0754634.1 YjbF family lipoprotein [Pseudoroseomonas vastitatis]